MLEERVRIVNYAELDEAVEVTLELAADAADIFEVRGWTRVARGHQLPIALRRDRVTFRYDGLDGRHTATYLAFSEPADSVEAVDPEVAGSVNAGWIRLTWHWPLAQGEARELHWVMWSANGEATSKGSRRDVEAEADERLFPAVPVFSADEVAASYHAWNRAVSEIRTDNELVNLAIKRSISDLRLLVNDGPARGRALPRGRRPVVRDPVRARLDHRVVPGAVRPAAGRRRDARRPRRAPGRRGGPGPRRRARQDPPRAAHGRDGADRRAAVPALLRVGGRHAAVADPARRDLRLDRRPRARRPPVAECLAGARLDRQLGRPRRRRVRRVRAADAVGPRQPGLEGLQRRDPRPARAPVAHPDRARRGPGLRVRRQDPHRRPRTHARRRGARVPPRGRRGAPPAAVRGRVLVRRPRVLRHGARRREAPGRRDGLERRPLPVVRDRLARTREPRRRPADGARHVQRLGDPDLRGGPARLQPDRLPHGHGLAARRRP